MDDTYYESKRDAAYQAYSAQPVIHSPFFGEDIVLGPKGFAHLSRPTKGWRTKEEQVQRFTLLPLGFHVLRTATTVQTYRKQPAGTGGRGPTKTIQWWGFTALFVEQQIGVRIVVRKVGAEKLQFWSVMLSPKPRGLTAPGSAAGAT
jgi:hypothetical protein